MCVRARACAHVKSLLSHVWVFATLWTVAHQAPLSIGISRQEYWRGWPCPPPGDLLDPEIKPRSPVAPASQVDSLPQVPPGQPQHVRALSISLQKLPLKENKRWVSSEQEVFTTDHTGHLHLLCPPLKPRKWSLYCWEVQVTSLIWLNIPPIFPLTLI